MKTSAPHRARLSLVACALAALGSLTGCVFEAEPPDDAAAIDGYVLGDEAAGYGADELGVPGADELGPEGSPAEMLEDADDGSEGPDSSDDEMFAQPLGEMFRGVGEPLRDSQLPKSPVLVHPSAPVLR